jgi:tetratricopeptide (TPR) repeat protein
MLPSLRLLASLALDDGDAVAAQAWCRRALVHHGRDPGVLHLLGRALKSVGATSTAYRVLSDCAAIAGDDAGVLTTLGAVCLDAGKPKEARRHLERALALGGVDARACDNLGIACWESGDQAAALAAFERAVAADPTFTPALRTSSTRAATCANGTVSMRSRRSSSPRSTRRMPTRAGHRTSRSPVRSRPRRSSRSRAAGRERCCPFLPRRRPCSRAAIVYAWDTCRATFATIRREG